MIKRLYFGKCLCIDLCLFDSETVFLWLKVNKYYEIGLIQYIKYLLHGCTIML
ncbi:hypothetical protein. In SS9 not in 3TCK. very small protein of 52 aa [Photobacterium kishitanii]|nr:hypothetical protein. In SS9 not in 3TCK. very small protein of 52 aa [Photobacterium kishitanii]